MPKQEAVNKQCSILCPFQQKNIQPENQLTKKQDKDMLWSICSGKITENISYYIVRNFMSWEVFDIFMVCVYNLCEFAAVHFLFKYPHVDDSLKLIQSLYIVPYNFGYCWAPAVKQTDL